jgi:hypothetical protein
MFGPPARVPDGEFRDRNRENLSARARRPTAAAAENTHSRKKTAVCVPFKVCIPLIRIFLDRCYSFIRMGGIHSVLGEMLFSATM